MTEPKILSVCWLPREKLKNRPDRVILQDEILRDENVEKFDEDNSENELDEKDLGNVPEVSAEKVNFESFAVYLLRIFSEK